ncbi:MAG: Holliday junction resolvase RecU [Lachnospiraceae bacterium]
MSDVSRVIQGRRSKASGDRFENILSAACQYYREKGMAIVEKTPEPMRPIKPYGNRRMGQYVACFVKQAQPDYKGVLCDGQAIIFEAKHTDKDRIQESAITMTQRQNLDDFQRMGAQCFVMVSMGFDIFHRVPWSVFGNMKSQFGRKYMTLEELEWYRLDEKNGIVLILEGVGLDG